MIISVFVAIIVTVLVYLVIRRMISKRAILIITNDAQKTTDEAMNEVLPDLFQHDDIETPHKPVRSETVVDMWGVGVMAFEYSFVVKSNKINMDKIRWQLNSQLNKYAEENEIQSFENVPRIFIVTDLWIYLDELHIDVAYVVNESTAEYVKDLAKL
ncbi:Uncharacterized protein LACOL_1155 [Paucilactobacillus oligofermentans DSM 15707 = LMG 22743]|nr:Uncharacterized protein LACOL_1155 [Paucilactobacillus oligofermentans DSM 15707 = LMG 22743]